MCHGGSGGKNLCSLIPEIANDFRRPTAQRCKQFVTILGSKVPTAMKVGKNVLIIEMHSKTYLNESCTTGNEKLVSLKSGILRNTDQ